VTTRYEPVHGSTASDSGHHAVYCGRCGRWLDIDRPDEATPVLTDHVRRAHRGDA
jgi:hypothetical protein